MGLDQYAFTVTTHPDNKLIDQDLSGDTRQELFYWRKHPDLHGWMEKLYRKRGGKEVFNCKSVKLTLEDLDALEKAVEGDSLPPTTGFFFGKSSPERFEEDREFIKKAREEIKNGRDVYYDSWW